MIQFGSYGELQRAVETFRYKTGWRCWLSGMTHGYAARPDISADAMTFGSGQTVLTGPALLHVQVTTDDSGGERSQAERERDERERVNPDELRDKLVLTHTFMVPDLAMRYPSGFTWNRWLLDRILDVETHEAMEFFEVEGRKPFFPEHGGSLTGLYEIRERRSEPSV